MDNSKLKLFTAEGDLRNYAKVNGYDEGGTEKLINRWKSLSKEKPLILSKKVTVIDTMETKSSDV